MPAIIDHTSKLYVAWHEAGHAVMCVHFGGMVEFVELLKEGDRHYGFTRCIRQPEHRTAIACGGFAAEFLLYREGRLNLNEKEFIGVAFRNANIDRQSYFGLTLAPDENFTREQDEEFSNFAIEYIFPLLRNRKHIVEQVANELAANNRVDGSFIKALLDDV